ncbi:hypothetical protein [Fangia hongkongensis]|uniref:hypothetical protein n=1 Tax=Fangia hongkongensis TaxID=270495 RepID=UPI0012B5DE50|nr:hypothetical protein [Fangia hongkongensis]MBK2125919.1 hypothetical protein [Fangia hongkongensis]
MLNLTGMLYTSISPNGEIHEVIIIPHPLIDLWAQQNDAMRGPLLSYTNMLSMPDYFFYHDLACFMCEPDKYQTLQNLKKTMVNGDIVSIFRMLRERDHAIAKIVLFSKQPIYGTGYTMQVVQEFLQQFEHYFWASTFESDFRISLQEEPYKLKILEEEKRKLMHQPVMSSVQLEIAKSLYFNPSLTSRELAFKVHRSSRTVESNLQRLYEVFGVNSKAALSGYLHENHREMLFFPEAFTQRKSGSKKLVKPTGLRHHNCNWEFDS